MAELKKVLVVDDHFEMLDFLRSMLELSSQNYDVLAVPSAEEGLLELRQKDFDLVITDVRLPGMSGFEFVRSIRRIKPAIPTIMITAYSSEQGKREAAELGVHRYFRKPLDTDEVLAAVHTALYGELVVHADEPVRAGDINITVPDEVPRRLETLRADTGSTGIALATTSGKILLQVGHGPGMNLPRLLKLIAANLDNSFLLTQELGGNVPITIQYHSGDKTELYVANVGRDYFLAIFFDAQTRRGRMGTIWVFAQRAIKDLLALLPKLDLSRRIKPEARAQQGSLSRDLAGAPKGSARPTSQAQKPDDRPGKLSHDVEKRREDAPEPAAQEGFFAPEDRISEDSADLKDFWDDGLTADVTAPVGRGQLSYEEAQRQGLVPSELARGGEEGASTLGDVAQTAPQETDTAPGATPSLRPAQTGEQDPPPVQVQSDTDDYPNLDTFWDDAIATDETGDSSGVTGFSWEEARRRGLIPNRFDSDEDGE
jgi:CheY-like chemotaxis protein